MAGEVIGITSAKIATVGVEGMGYAISSETAIPLIEELVQKGYVVRPWLGVVLYTVDQFATQRYELAVDEGVLITQVVPDSPASRAGLAPGDVIVSVDGEKTATAEALIQILRISEIGQELELTYWRGDTQNTTRVILAERPPS